MAIIGLLMVAAVPASIKFYENIQYRQGVRDVVTLLGTARQVALDRGRAQDVSFDPATNTIALGSETRQLPRAYTLSLTTAREVNRQNTGIIRFYPEGGSSGGDVIIATASGGGVMISVDWLMGSIRQVAIDG